VRRAAYSNGQEIRLFLGRAYPVHLMVFFFSIRGSVCGGLPKQSWSDFGSRRGFSPRCP